MNKNSKRMELIAPPRMPQLRPGDPRAATAEDIRKLGKPEILGATIAGAAAAWTNQCEGNDRYDNNCAHFLSDAFIRAGFTDLSPPCNCINARCGTSAKRPIRAAEMNCWFKSKAKKTEGSPPANSGMWAVFQLDTTHYCCGHVVIIDTDNNTYYGTGNYPNWAQQFAYQW
jgi:hypothetical protein